MHQSPAPPPDPWHPLRRLTTARIALGRAGSSLPTRELLDFSLAHARARDAVAAEFDAPRLVQRLAPLGLDCLVLRTAAENRRQYLLRPDLGRKLHPRDRDRLAVLADGQPPCALALVVSDGLSARAAESHAPPLLAELVPRLLKQGWRLAPLCVVALGRVAVEDEIGALLGAELALILLGERPGLTAADSLGAYLVFQPAPGRTDAQRNCVSNIHPAGRPPAEAAVILHYLLTEARRRRLSGIALKADRALAQRHAPPMLDPRHDA